MKFLNFTMTFVIVGPRLIPFCTFFPEQLLRPNEHNEIIASGRVKKTNQHSLNVGKNELKARNLGEIEYKSIFFFFFTTVNLVFKYQLS